MPQLSLIGYERWGPPMHVIKLLALAVTLAFALSGCAATQMRIETLQMSDDISNIREQQVLRNISMAISDHDFVPAEVWFATGQANVTTGYTGGFKLPQFDFSRPSRELDLGATDTWVAQWQMTAVANAEDLRRLRNLYALVVSTDQQYDELEKYLDTKWPKRKHCLTSKDAAAGAKSSGTEEEAEADAAVQSKPDEPPRAGTGPGAIPQWCDALELIETGDSIGCKVFQAQQVVDRRRNRSEPRRIPFRRWLYWRPSGAASWQPEPPDAPILDLGRRGQWQIGITSRACFNDFVILVQAQTPATEKAAAAGPKPNE